MLLGGKSYSASPPAILAPDANSGLTLALAPGLLSDWELVVGRRSMLPLDRERLGREAADLQYSGLAGDGKSWLPDGGSGEGGGGR